MFYKESLHKFLKTQALENLEKKRKEESKYSSLNSLYENSVSFNKGGTSGNPPKKPIYVTNPNDPRLKAYQDSLMLYDKGQQAAERYKNTVYKYNFDPAYIERWRTDGYVDTDIHPTIGGIYNGILKNSGGGFERDSKERVRDYNYYPAKGGVQVKIYADTPIGQELSNRFTVYKKPEQPVVFRPDPEIIARQQQLIDAGFKIGKADGIWGPRSEAAWQEFQRIQGAEPPTQQATEQVPPLAVAPLETTPQQPTSTLQQPQMTQQPVQTSQPQTSPQIPEGYNVWTHNGQPLDPQIYGYAPSTSGPRQISQFADTHALKRANEAYSRLGATPWATTGNKLVTDLYKPYFSKQAATNALEQTAQQLRVPVDQLQIIKAPAGFTGYVIVQTLPQRKYGGIFKDGGTFSEDELTPAQLAMMKARFAYAEMHGNPAAQRMVASVDNPYQFDNGDTGTHYMASMDNYAVPQIQLDENGNLVLGDYGPLSRESFMFDTEEDAEVFSTNYKKISPAFKHAAKKQIINNLNKIN